ncbi:PLP-dependent aminotransferase family protein [Aestuariibacter halophilus]|uniref:PLP-dependent aminotransferase family protein n=1 Tax=Fluctibacter halophilus TaxID=226011 RepID=A0ABS8G5A9_9ALTE|nr:PLP-dependent aminotransferase family protein [Aestuariibacter halophilus]MCC2615291.1 PLP-dependent aminotransferase family protein [Aestuariibacter halophilus]
MPSTPETYLYQRVITLIRAMHSDGRLRPGDKLPSLRSLSQSLAVSVPTIKQAYLELERQGVIEARPQSGYYLKPQDTPSGLPLKARAMRKPTAVSRQQLIEQVYQAIHLPQNLSLGVANPVAAKPPTKALNRTVRRVLTMAGDKALNYGPMSGYEPLKRLLAWRYMEQGINVAPDDVVITNGAQEAISIALQSVAKPGDVIAVESPCYFGVLELIERLGMLALEIPLCAQKGLALDDVKKAISKHPVKACVFSTTIANPLGCRLQDSEKADLVALLEARNIALIEDDVYGDLYFGEQRGIPCQAFSKKGLVLTCASFSKTAAPSYRIGWLVAPGFRDLATRTKRALSCSSPLINQWTLTEFIQSGEYDRYLKLLRQVLLTNRDRMLGLIGRHFPDDVRVTLPQGGTVLWLELSGELDGAQLFQQALEHNISITPGSLFSPSSRYQHCIRLSYGLPWHQRIEDGIETLGRLCHTP